MAQSQPCVPSSSSSSTSADGEARSICKLVLPLLRSQEFDKADSLMEDAHLRYHGFPSILALLRITGVIQLFKSEFLEEDLCVPDALCCAKIATQLSPFNLECSFFYVKLLVSYYQRYKEAIKECERSLAVINPIADAADYMRASNFQEVGHVTPEEGWINYYKEQLRSFLITARDGLIDENLPGQRQDQELYDSSCPVSREVMDTCERALALLKSKNFTKADRLLQKVNFRRHNSFAFFHRVCATAHYYVGAHAGSKDLEAKKKRFQEAIVSAERATRLSPSNLEYSLSYVSLLTCCGEGFPEAVKECERALAVTDPTDFFFERFLKDETTKARMAFYQHSLRSILKTRTVDPIADIRENIPVPSSSSLASTSTDPPPASDDEKNHSDQALSLRDQDEQHFLSPASSSAIAFTSTNPLPSTEKAKDIADPDVQIPHHPSHSPSSSLFSISTDPQPSSDEVKNLRRALQLIDGDDPVKAKNILNGILHKHKLSAVFHRVRSLVLCCYAKKLINDPEGQLCQFQEALISAHQATILSPNNLEFSVYYVSQLVFHCKYEEAAKECERALAVNNPTDFLIECVKESSQESSTLKRISFHQDQLQFHLHVLKWPNLSAKCRETLLNDRRAVLFRTYLLSLQNPAEWRDLLRVQVKELKNRFEINYPGEALSFGHENLTWKYWLCPCCSYQGFKDSESMWQHVLKEHLQEPSEELKSLFPKQLDQDWADRIVQGRWEPIEIHAPTANDKLRWSLSTDTERRNHLRRIKYNFWMLITNNCLSMSHIDNVLKYAMGEIQVLPSAKELQNVLPGDRLILSIRLLNSLQLKEVFDFLESLMKACKLGPYAESHGPSHDAFLDSPEDDIRIGVTLDDSFLYIDLDMKPLARSENTSSPHDETWSPPDVNSIVCWLYEDQDLTEKIDASTQRQDEADKCFKKLQKEYKELTLNCSQKCKLLEYQDALKCLKNKCENEFVETSASAESQIQCKKELAERAESRDDFVVSNSSVIFTEEEAFEESRNRDGSVNQSDNNDDNNLRTNSKNNSCINSAFRKIDEASNEKLCIADAKIMKNIATIRHLQLSLKRACVLNDRVYLIPLLRVYMKEALELRLIGSESHVEDSFTELLHDDKENMDKSEYSQKQLRETSRGKKKGSSSKKSKGRKSR